MVLAGSPWGQELPRSYEHESALVFWLTHHDISAPGYEKSARITPRELPGISLVINGHIHRPLPDVVHGQTTWATPGNIARVARGEIHRNRIPSVLRIDVDQAGWSKRAVAIPHEPYEEVFHPAAAPVEDEEFQESSFVHGLVELQRLRTSSGAGLVQFLDLNLPRYPDLIAQDIRALAREAAGD